MSATSLVMRIGLAQINPHLGSFKKNREKILEWIGRAADRRCDLVLFPEMSLFGYHPGDLLERESVVKEQIKEFDRLAKKMPEGITALVGLVHRNTKKRGKKFINAAALLQKGKKPKIFAKELLPTYDVFDDHRHIEPGDLSKNIFRFKGKKCLVTICEDIWGWNETYSSNPLKKLKSTDVDLVLNLSGSPYTVGKRLQRKKITTLTAKHFKSPLVYVNLVGAQDELIFDGGSFAIDQKGKVLAQNAFFAEDLTVVDIAEQDGEKRPKPSSKTEEIRQALVLGIYDFVFKTGLGKVHLGLSGGIDSAVVASLAVDALGPQRVSCFGLPSEFNAPESLQLACDLAKNLGCEFREMNITRLFESAKATLNDTFGELEFSLVHENLQARIRGLLLMAYANKENSLLLTTGNKSEYATGYSTLYGDMCGGLAPIADLVKSRVYNIARLYNDEHELIPTRIIDRPPSAELRPNQKDEDSLPQYDVLDRAVEKIVEKYASARGETETWVLNAMMGSEFKRWQAPPVLKVTGHAFGRGRRFPVAHTVRK